MLDAYLQQALQSNDALRGMAFRLDQSHAALREAESLFLPRADFSATYTLAAGGRKIELPVGDLLNPVYATLNQLTQSNNFPAIANTSSNFLPNNFLDARIRILQPLLNAELRYNRRIKGEMIPLQTAEMNVYKRELVGNVKSAYFTYLQAAEALRVYDQALEMLRESRRVNDLLVKNDMALPSVNVRAEAEINKVLAQRETAELARKNAAAYFNFLLNRPFAEAIATDSALLADMPQPPAENGSGPENREELDQLASAQRINTLVLEMDKSYWKPRAGLSLDLGSQSFLPQWGGYVLGGVSIEMPIWAGNRNKYKIEQRELDLKILETRQDETEDQLRLQVETSLNAFRSARIVYDALPQQIEALRRYYRDVLRRYREGQAPFIELLDARTEVSLLELQQNLARFNVFLRAAEWERAAATYAF